MKYLKAALAAVFALALSAPVASAATVPVTSLSGQFSASNSTVHSTPEGVHFGTYADAGIIGGTVIYTGANGPLSSLTEFGYTFTYRHADNSTGAAPYARVFIDEDPAVDADGDGNAANDVQHSIILDPSNCGAVEPAQATDLTFNMSTTPVRLDDDPGNDCANTTMTFAAAKAAVLAGAPNAAVSSLNVTQGFSTGQDVSALLRNIVVNADTFRFDVPPAQGQPGVTTVITRVVEVPVFVNPVTAIPGCANGGATVRTLHAPRRPGARFLRVNAALQTPAGFKSLPVSGRTITLDLRGKAAGNYNVRLISRYRTKSGKVVRIVTRRNLSVAACA